MGSKVYSYIVLAFCINVCASFMSCQQKKARNANRTNTEERWLIFENDYLSFKYPDSYYVEDNFNFGADNLQDTPAGAKEFMTNELDVFPYNPTKDKPWLHIVLSRFKIQLPLREFMQSSIAIKGNGEEEVHLVSDIDSTSIAGLPALAVTFAYPQEFGDTLVQRQTIVRLPDRKLFYININCYREIVHNSEKLAPVFKTLETLQFK